MRRQRPHPRCKTLAILLVATLGLAGGMACSDERSGAEKTAKPASTPPNAPRAAAGAPAPAPAGPAASLVIDGSSTVFPITEAVAGAVEAERPNVEIRLGVSGTGGGFKKFCAGETAIQNASRPIKAKEAELCAAAGISFVELPVAFDGLTFVVPRANTWAACLTLDELRRLWEPAAEGRLLRWSDLRRGWPNQPIQLYGAGRDSGTFDYMTSAVIGKEGEARRDFIGSEDDYLLAQKVAADPSGLGFFGFAYYREYQSSLHAVAIDAGAGCVGPDEKTIVAGTYRPLSRPIFIYVARAALEREEVRAFAEFYLEAAPRLVPAAKYVALPERAYTLARRRLAERIPGSLFGGGSRVGVSIEELLEMESSGLARRP
jgi:phosphate transport system substrate-binding protein